MTTGGRSRAAPEGESLPKFERVRSRGGNWYLACGEVITFLFEFLEEEIPAERRNEFDRHLAICPSCRNYLASYRETLLLLRRERQLEEAEIPEMPQHLVEILVRARS
ncbi:MAG: zf-HC2 domain-containing protein [Candidatus Binatia bacterium]